MPTAENHRSPYPDDALTIASIAILAFVVADMAHEGLGHGLGFYFAGGHSSMLTTTRLIEWVKLGDPQWRIFDLGGPAGNFTFGFLGWLGQRLLKKNHTRLRLFFWLVMVFSLFWGFGYLIVSGVLARGDYMALIEGTRFVWPGRAIFVVVGLVLYRASIRLASSEFRWIMPVGAPNAKSRAAHLIWIVYLSGGLIACTGAIFDPRGRMEILNSGALSSFGAAIGLLSVANTFARLPTQFAAPEAALSRGLPWIIAAASVAVYYIGILGPGILLWFEN